LTFMSQASALYVKKEAWRINQAVEETDL